MKRGHRNEKKLFDFPNAEEQELWTQRARERYGAYSFPIPAGDKGYLISTTDFSNEDEPPKEQYWYVDGKGNRTAATEDDYVELLEIYKGEPCEIELPEESLSLYHTSDLVFYVNDEKKGLFITDGKQTVTQFGDEYVDEAFYYADRIWTITSSFKYGSGKLCSVTPDGKNRVVYDISSPNSLQFANGKVYGLCSRNSDLERDISVFELDCTAIEHAYVGQSTDVCEFHLSVDGVLLIEGSEDEFSLMYFRQKNSVCLKKSENIESVHTFGEKIFCNEYDEDKDETVTTVMDQNGKVLQKIRV